MKRHFRAFPVGTRRVDCRQKGSECDEQCKADAVLCQERSPAANQLAAGTGTDTGSTVML